jgi:predicted acylesterase/phospholipase RssA
MSSAPRERTPFNPPPARPLLECDLVLKGGITSGVVYPQALASLAQDYRFRCIGGASAGAIAAGFAAAAEYRRQAVGDPGGFTLLHDLPKVLGASTNGKTLLFELFQPQAQYRPLFRFLAAFARQKNARLTARLVLIAERALSSFPWRACTGAAAGLAVAALIGWVGRHFQSPVGVVSFAAGALLLALLGAAIGALSGIWRAVTALPLNGFGLCRGYDETGGGVQLTSWLHEQIQGAAGLPVESPLTFRDLGSRGVTLKVMTSNLGYRAPHTVPFAEGDAWPFYDPRSWSALFPREVMRQLIAASERCLADAKKAAPTFAKTIELVKEKQGLLVLPKEDLPVLVAVRLSLSFPILLSAVPLAFVDLPERGAGEARWCWLSDGGISSNFPVHFFDAAIPGRPTFAINLEEVEEDFPGPFTWVAKKNRDGLVRPWVEVRANRSFSSLLGFLLAIFDTMQNWRDNSRLRLPGYRDRVAAVRLKPSEGGLNLNMTGTQIGELAERGREAAEMLAAHFGPAGAAGVETTWENHRWLRLLSTLSGMEKLLEEFEAAWQAPSPFARSYPDLLDPARTPKQALPSYREVTNAQRVIALTCLNQLRGVLAQQRAILAAPWFKENTPRPPLRFRLTSD